MWQLKPLRLDPPRHDPRGRPPGQPARPPTRPRPSSPPLCGQQNGSGRQQYSGCAWLGFTCSRLGPPRIRASPTSRPRWARRQRHNKRASEPRARGRGNSARSLAFRRPTNGRARAGGPPATAQGTRPIPLAGTPAWAPRVAPLAVPLLPRLRAARAYVPTCPAAVWPGPPVLCSPYSNVRARRAARSAGWHSIAARAARVRTPSRDRPGRAVVWLDPEGGGSPVRATCARRLPGRPAPRRAHSAPAPRMCVFQRARPCGLAASGEGLFCRVFGACARPPAAGRRT
jgi:hypothetical protein